MRYFHPITIKLMHECAALFIESKIDSFLFLDRFIELNNNLFVENANVKFANFFLEQSGTDRDWDQWMRQTYAFFTGGQTGLAKEKSDISYSYNQALRHINNMLNLINANPEADNPAVLKQVKINLTKLKQNFDTVKPMIDGVRDRIMNVAVNKMQGVNAPLAGSVDFSQFASLKDQQIYPKLADMISRNPEPSTPEGKFLNLIKNNQLRFGSTVINNAKSQLQLVDTSLVKRVIKSPKLIDDYKGTGPNARKIKLYKLIKDGLFDTLAPEQQTLLNKFFGDDNAVYLAFLKFKNTLPQQTAPSRMEDNSAKIQQNNDNIRNINNHTTDIKNWFTRQNSRINSIEKMKAYIDQNNPPITDSSNLINIIATRMGRNPQDIANKIKYAVDVLANYNSVPLANRRFFKQQNRTFRNIANDLQIIVLRGLP